MVARKGHMGYNRIRDACGTIFPVQLGARRKHHILRFAHDARTPLPPRNGGDRRQGQDAVGGEAVARGGHVAIGADAPVILQLTQPRGAT